MYTSFYNLREEPFRLTSDPKFFHLSEPHAAALAALIEAVMRRKGFVLMTGMIGTGKTTVVHTALQILWERATTSNPISSAFILNPTLSREEFLEMILTEFEITCTGTSKPARLSALQQMLLDTQRRGGTSLLFVDEAHLLSPELLEEIRLLSNADTYQEKLLQIVLCAQTRDARAPATGGGQLFAPTPESCRGTRVRRREASFCRISWNRTSVSCASPPGDCPSNGRSSAAHQLALRWLLDERIQSAPAYHRSVDGRGVSFGAGIA
jgi:hypothetical protein